MTKPVSEGTKKNLVAIIGGSGVNDMPMFKHETDEWLRFETDYKLSFQDGSTTDGIVYYKTDSGKAEDARVIFIPRHGIGDRFRSPSRTQYAANLIAARMLGAAVVIGTSAVGSLTKYETYMGNATHELGTLVIPEGYVDETGRDGNLWTQGLVLFTGSNPAFSPQVRDILRSTAFQGDYFLSAKADQETNGALVDTSYSIQPDGTYVCIPGDRFGTPGEGRKRAVYGDIVGMTICPEAAVTRSLGMHYACATFVVDFDGDANHEGRTLKVMDELSQPHRVPSYMTRVVEKAVDFAHQDLPVEGLSGNIVVGDLQQIQNPHLRAIAQDLVATYHK